MGPIAHRPEYSPGVLVMMKESDHGLGIGTIVDNFVNFHIDTGHRTEQALVLWSHGCSLWVNIGRLVIVEKANLPESFVGEINAKNE